MKAEVKEVVLSMLPCIEALPLVLLGRSAALYFRTDSVIMLRGVNGTGLIEFFVYLQFDP